MRQEIFAQLCESAETKRRVAREMLDELEAAAQLVIDCYAAGHKVLLCGNGGSAADAQHIAAEFVGRFRRERRALPSIALTTDTSILTGIGNDYGYDRTFARQAEAWVENGDVLIAISTSGDSPNVLAAVEVAQARGAATIGLCGRDGGRLAVACDIPLVVPADSTARIQEAHITIGHILCDLVERSVAQDDTDAPVGVTS